MKCLKEKGNGSIRTEGKEVAMSEVISWLGWVLSSSNICVVNNSFLSSTMGVDCNAEWVAPVARLLFWVFLSATVIIVLVIFWDKINNWIPGVRFVKRRKARRPENLILRQIIYLNASFFINGNDCLDVGIIFPTFLPKKLELAKMRGYITVDGHATEEQEFRPITLFDHSLNENQLRVSLTAQVSARVRERIQTNNQVEIALYLTGWDVKKTRYDLSTRGWTTKFLT